MWEDFVEYNSIRTTFLKTFVELNFKAGDNLLPYFLKSYEETNSVFYAWLRYSSLKKTGESCPDTIISDNMFAKLNDYFASWYDKKQINKYLRELFPEMMNSGYDIRNMENDIPNFSPYSIEEFYNITKGKYYLGYDLDQELEHMIPFVKEQDLIEEYMEQIQFYFKFRYDNYPMSLLCEYASIPFGTHESRAERYRKTGNIRFELPREESKYPVFELFSKYCSGHDLTGTRLINIRGTNGSGKTTMVNNIYQDSVAKGMAKEYTIPLTDAKDKTRNRYYDVLEDKKIVLLGGYNTPFGTKGTDRIGDVYEIIQGICELFVKYKGYTIIVESATVSTSFWAYAILYFLLMSNGASVNIVTLLMKDWNFITNNIKNRTERKEGAKEPDYEGAIRKREILYKNHFRFSSMLGKESCMIMYPDTCVKEEMQFELSRVIETHTGTKLL